MKKEEILSEIKKIEIAVRRKINAEFAGKYASTYRGRGIELAGLREYSEQDDYRLIDWNATARTGKPHTRILQEERGLELYLIVDVSASMRCGGSLYPPAKNKLETASVAAAVLGFSAASARDKTGAILFSGDIEETIDPSYGRNHAFVIAEKILDSDPVSSGSAPWKVFESFPRSFRKKGICVIISDMEFEIPWKGIMKAARSTVPAVIRVTDRHQAGAAGKYSFDALDSDPDPGLQDTGKKGRKTVLTGKKELHHAGTFRPEEREPGLNRGEKESRTAAALGIPWVDISSEDNIAEKVYSLFRGGIKTKYPS